MHSWIEIDSSAVKHNLKEFSKLFGKKILLMPVIKANAYGHGLLQMAQICNVMPEVDRVCVVNDDEADFLIKNNIKKPVMIIGFFEFDKKKSLKLAKKNVIFPIFSLKQAKFLSRVGDRLQKKIKIHIKFDIGTSRLGFLFPVQINEIKQILKLKWLEIEGIYGHLASSESNATYTYKQMREFQHIVSQLKKLGIDPKIRHVGCTAASVLFPEARFNAIRLGLGLYGLYSSPKMIKKIILKPALSLYTKILQIKRIQKGKKIGYGGTYTTKNNIDLAILPVGYWDGYDRRLSNNSHVLINGKKCPVRGKICMNLTMVELPPKHKAKEGDTAVLIGKQSGHKISIDVLANKCKTINYEFVDRLNPTIPRLYV